DLLEHLQPFSADGGLEILEARNVSPGTRQVRNEAAANRIGNDDEDDRDCLSHFSYDRSRRVGPDDNDVRRERAQLFGAGTHAFGHLAGEPEVKSDVAAFVPAKFVKTLPEGRKILLHHSFMIVGERHQYSDVSHAPRLLRTRGERPVNRGTEQRDELAPSHTHSQG